MLDSAGSYPSCCPDLLSGSGQSPGQAAFFAGAPGDQTPPPCILPVAEARRFRAEKRGASPAVTALPLLMPADLRLVAGLLPLADASRTKLSGKVPNALCKSVVPHRIEILARRQPVRPVRSGWPGGSGSSAFHLAVPKVLAALYRGDLETAWRAAARDYGSTKEWAGR